MKEMEHRSGTFFSGESRIVEQQKEQHSTSSTSQTPSAPRHPEIFYMLHVGKLDEAVQWFSAAQQQQHSSSSTAAAVQQQWWRRRRGAVFGPSTPGQTRTPNEETFLQDSLLCILRVCIADQHLRIVLRDASRIVEQQKQQHTSSSTPAVMAATSRLRTTRTSEDTPVSFLLSFLRFRAIRKGRARTHREVLVDHCRFTVPLNTLRIHTRLTAVYLFRLRFSGALSNISGCRSRVAPCKQ